MSYIMYTCLFVWVRHCSWLSDDDKISYIMYTCLFVWVRHCSWLSDDDKISYIPYICLFVWYVIAAFRQVRNFVLL